MNGEKRKIRSPRAAKKNEVKNKKAKTRLRFRLHRNVNHEDKKNRPVKPELLARFKRLHALGKARRFARGGFPVQRTAPCAARERGFNRA